MKLTNILFLLILLATPAYAGDAAECDIEGDRIHWIADYCFATLETDDEIAAMDCISREMERAFANDCAAKRHYKRALCELALSREAITGTLESCLRDKNFVGDTVRNKGVGN